MNKKYLILIIIALAFLLRIIGLDYGLPYFFVGDEQPLVAGALKMAEIKTLLPVLYPKEFRLLYYPPLMSYIFLILLTPFILLKYILGSWVSFEAYKNFLILNPTFIWIIARFITAILGTATVYLIYLIGKRFFNKWTGLLAALFLSLSFFHTQFSHFARHWIPAVFFAYIVIFLAICIWQKPQKKYYLWSGFFAGLAFGVSYFTAISFLVVFIIHFLSKKESFEKKLKDKKLWLAILIFIVLAFIFVILHPQEFIRLLFGEDSTAGQVKSLSGLLFSFVYYIQALLYFEPVILIFSILGLMFLWFKSKKEWLIFASWPILYIIIFYFLFHHEARYILFIIPWLSVLAAYGLYFLLQKIPNMLIIFLILILIFIYPLAVVVKYDYLLIQPDSRILAKNWIEESIAPNSRIVTDWAYIKLIATKEAIILQQSLDKNSLRTDDRILLTIENKNYPKTAYNDLRLHFIGQKLPDDLSQYLKDNNYQYFIVEYWQKNNLTKQDKSIIADTLPIEKINSGLSEDYAIDLNGNILEPITEIFSIKRLGPNIEIYKL